MTLMEKLGEEAVWKEYLEYKMSGAHFTDREKRDLEKFIEKKQIKFSDDHFLLPIYDSIHLYFRYICCVIYTHAEIFPVKTDIFLTLLPDKVILCSAK